MAALWQTSLTRLSVEIEGHALGGGMLKLGPTEAERVLVPSPRREDVVTSLQLGAELDELLRAQRGDEARQRANEVFLRGLVNLSESACRLLDEGADVLRARRRYQNETHGTP